jgi:hypothetical protein
VENEKYPKIMDDAEPPDENCLWILYHSFSLIH